MNKKVDCVLLPQILSESGLTGLTGLEDERMKG